MNPPQLKSLLRARYRQDGQSEDAHKVTSIELFFDLVFVFAITQLSHFLIGHFSLLGIAQTFLLLMAVWWVWIYTSWTTNWFDPDRRPVRLLLFAMMFVGLLMSSSIPHAFESSGWVFAGSYVLLQMGRTVFVVLGFLREKHTLLARNFQRLIVWLLVAMCFWFAGAFAEGSDRFTLWAIALFIEYLGPSFRFWVPFLGATDVKDWNIEGNHMAERCSLFIIIALGESILVTGSGFSHLAWTAETVAAFVTAFVGSLTLWWLYFDTGAEKGSHTIAHAIDPGRLGRLVYTYIHVLLVAGIVVSAVADEIVLEHPHGAVNHEALFAVVGGAILYLVGNILFKRAIVGRLPLSHLAGLAALIGLLFVGSQMTVLTLSIITTVILVIVAIWESISLRQGHA